MAHKWRNIRGNLRFILKRFSKASLIVFLLGIFAGIGILYLLERLP